MDIAALIKRIEEGTASEKDLADYSAWCDAFQIESAEKPRFDHIKQSLLEQIDARTREKSLPRLQPYYRIAVAAAVFVILTVSIYFLLPELSDQSTSVQTAKMILPGSNKATIILPGGRAVALSAAHDAVVTGKNLRYADGTPVENTTTSNEDKRLNSGTAMLTATTPRGGTYAVTLPDGTKVHLNSASSISFPVSFAGLKARIVKITGEVYFEVAKQEVITNGKRERLPFIVQSSGQQVEVLGTHFNINAYGDEATARTTLTEGSIKISATATGEKKLIRPGQQAVLNGSLSVIEVNTEDALAWKSGYFKFNNETLESVMKKISRWYDVKINYAGEMLKQENVYGSISRQSDIAKVLKLMQLTGRLKFEIEGREITVTTNKPK